MKVRMTVRIWRFLLLQACALMTASGLTLYINTSQALHATSDKYLSAALDQGTLRDVPQFDGWDFNSPRLLSLLKGLAPMYLRFGGTIADRVVYSDVSSNLTETLDTKPPLYTMTSGQWEAMLKLTTAARVRYLHDFNLQLRYGTQWDPSNAISVLQHITSKGYGENLDFELGNEPGVYKEENGNVFISGKQIGADFLLFHRVINKFPVFRNSACVGPDSVLLQHAGPSGAELVKQFVEAAGSVITAMTFHHYYFWGHGAKVGEFINPKHFYNLEHAINVAYRIMRNTSYPNTSLWLGETSNCWGGGTPNITDRYVDGFLWLEKLGLSARMGVQVVIRQTVFGDNYALIDTNLYPNPSYWLSYIFKQLVGTTVLNVEQNDNLLVRVYAHCTSTRSGKYQKGAVTVFALNVSQNETTTLNFTQDMGQEVHVYLLTPGDQDGLISRYVSLNGRPLMMVDDYTMPIISPYRTQLGAGIKIPPLTFGYWVFPHAAAQACL